MKAFSALFVNSILLSLRTSTTLDTITPSQSIRDGETLISAGGRFEMGLFSPGSLESRYVGIWFGMSNETVVWVANRETPLKNYHGVLKVTNKEFLSFLIAQILLFGHPIYQELQGTRSTIQLHGSWIQEILL